MAGKKKKALDPNKGELAFELATQGFKMPKGKKGATRKHGGQVVKRQAAGVIGRGIKKRILDPLKEKAVKKAVTTQKRKRKPPLETEAIRAGRGKGIEAAKNYLYKKDRKGNFKLHRQSNEFGEYDPRGRLVYTLKSRVKPKTILKAADVAIGAGGALAIKKATEGKSKMNKKSGGQIVKRQFAGRIAKGIKKQMLDPLKEKAAKRTATAASVSKVQQDGIIRRFARDNGKAAAIKKFGADRVAKVSMPTKRIGKPRTIPRHGEGGFGISGSSQTGQPRLLPDDSWVVRGGTGGGRKSGGKITYKMTGGQVVAHGYD